MNHDLTLLIMAAGMGSRYGGLKQIEPVGPNSAFLIDYSIYDAIHAGFTKVVFVIKKENEDIFRKTVGNRVSKYIKVEYAFQSLDDIPLGYKVPEEREKPWGTAQAVLCAKDVIHEPFAIINADDFYGREAYEVASHFLRETSNDYAIVGYKAKNTLSQFGAVKRAVLMQDGAYLTGLVECNIERENDQIISTPINGIDSFAIEDDALVSMNMFCLKPSVFSYLEKEFSHFLDTISFPLTSEYLIPEALHTMMTSHEVFIKVLSTNSTWYGITYKEDKKSVVENIQSLIDKKEYPCNLWLEENIKT